MTQATGQWTPTYSQLRLAMRRGFRRSYLFWPVQLFGLAIVYDTVAEANNYGSAYLAFLAIPALYFAVPELAAFALLRNGTVRAPRRLTWTDESVAVETPDSRFEYRWSAIGRTWHDRGALVIARNVRGVGSLVAVAPDEAFESDEQRVDLLTRIGAARRPAGRPEP